MVTGVGKLHRSRFMNGDVNMSILSALSLAQLQTINHLLQEMEVAGVPDLPAARLIVAKATDEQHRMRQSRVIRKVRKVAAKVHSCPDCGKGMRFCSTAQAYACTCGYSTMEVQ